MMATIGQRRDPRVDDLAAEVRRLQADLDRAVLRIDRLILDLAAVRGTVTGHVQNHTRHDDD